MIGRALDTLGLSPVLEASGGGSDANVFIERGITALPVGIGVRSFHTTLGDGADSRGAARRRNVRGRHPEREGQLMANVVIVVFDGLQPAQVTPELMPNLSRLAAEGVTGGNHHAVFPTVTRANVASIVSRPPPRRPRADGQYAGHTRVRPAQCHQRPGADADPGWPLIIQCCCNPPSATFSAGYGQEYIAIGTGTSGNAYLQNPNAETGGGATIHPDFCLPRPLHGEITARFGPWPGRRAPVAEKLARAVDMIHRATSLQNAGPRSRCCGSPNPIRRSTPTASARRKPYPSSGKPTGQFGRLLALAGRTGRMASDTNIIVVSDHGYSTISEVIDVEAELRAAGFPPADQPGGVAVAPNGGSALFYAPS